MKLDIYKIEILQADKGKSLSALNIDRRWLKRAREGKETRPQTVKKIADNLGVTPEEITIRG